MTNHHLQQLVEEISLRYFAKPFRHRARFNSRLRSTGGRYYLKSHDIDINPKMLTDFSGVTLVKVIKHELCHYHLHLAGYSGRHDTPEFKQLLAAVGGSRYAPQPKHVHWLKYRCQKCGRIYWRRRHLNTNRYVCSYCYGPLKLEG
ncbi:MAG: SprT family protein [Acetilactobacillus jinshanensis]